MTYDFEFLYAIGSYLGSIVDEVAKIKGEPEFASGSSWVNRTLYGEGNVGSTTPGMQTSCPKRS